MNGHPGGDTHTMRMIELCALSPGARVLDMGAGEGEAVALLRAHGLDAVGIDLISVRFLCERRCKGRALGKSAASQRRRRFGSVGRIFRLSRGAFSLVGLQS